MDKSLKLSVCLGFALAGWIIPASMPLPKPLQGISLGFALTATIAGATESKRETVRNKFSAVEREQEFELLATERVLRHKQRMRQLYDDFGFDDEDYHDRDQDDRYPAQPQLDGATIHQSVIEGGRETIESFDLDWLLRSPNLHLLITGDTGDGKTTLTKWIAQQFNAKQGKVYDPDYDGSDWGFPAVSAPLEDYTEIRGNMRVDLSEFEKRKPNDPANPKTVFIVEEMPSTIPECAEDGEKWLKLLLRRGRKRNLFVIGVSQDRNADTFKLKSAAVLSNFTVIYLGGYGEGALDRVRDRREREAIRAKLRQSKRPALVQFKGRFYPWDIPDLSDPTGKPNQPQNTAQKAVQSLTGDAAPTTTIAALESALRKKVEPTALHWKAIDLALSKGGLLSTRDAMRSLGIGTADEARQLFQILQGFELGETIVDRLPNGTERFLFRAYPPMG